MIPCPLSGDHVWFELKVSKSSFSFFYCSKLSVTTVVILKKGDDVHLCVDMLMLNRAILRERHPTHTVDDLIHTLHGTKGFSKLDLR